jgi:2-polyprenyl-6-methoxyphenol hydroxylase-like FAD-dependent oxidoreductase
VHVRRRDGGGARTVAADLVVDASGRRSKADRWLAELGYGPVPEETVASGLGYASRFYARPPGFPREWSMVLVNGRAPDNPRAGLVTEVENDTWHVTLGGLAGEEPPTDEEGFLAYAARVADPSVYEAVRTARPLGPIRGWRTPTNRLRHFERLRRWPAGFVATADSVCAFNPIYGQGMTVAAMDAFVLAEALERSGGGRAPGFERRFQRRLARAVATPWTIASTEDLRWRGVTLAGARPRRGTGLVRRYLDAVLRVAVHDTPLADRYFSVISMTSHPRALFHPRVVARVVRLTLAGRRGPARGALSAPGLAAARALPAAAEAVGRAHRVA